jgi:hypothetical protein
MPSIAVGESVSTTPPAAILFLQVREAMMTRNEIIVRIGEQRAFFRKQWDRFCDWVEECGKQLAKYQAEQTDEYYQIMEAGEQSEKMLQDARDRNDAKAIARWEKKCSKLYSAHERAKSNLECQTQTLKAQGWVPWSDRGIIPGFCTGMLNLPKRGTFYAPPETVNPVLWLLGAGEYRDFPAMETIRGRDLSCLSAGRNPRAIKDEEIIHCDFAILCAWYDSVIGARERPIYSLNEAYAKPYFQCHEFYKALRAETAAMETRGEIERAWEWVKGLLPKAKGAANQPNGPGQAGGKPDAQSLREWAGA